MGTSEIKKRQAQACHRNILCFTVSSYIIYQDDSSTAFRHKKQQRASTCFIIYQEPFVYKDFQHFHTKQYFVWLRLFSFICHKNCHKRATPNKGNGSDYYITFSSFFISFCTLAASTWLYMFIVMLMSLCPMIICKTLISIAILLINANSRCAEPPFAIVRTYCF